jgi:hypothetical protein
MNPTIEKLLATIEEYRLPSYLRAEEHEPKLEADELVANVAKYYEKARYAVDFKEEHMLRHTAIGRILKRRLVYNFTVETNARSLLLELIQAGYLPNNKLPERVVEYVQQILDKTIFLLSLIRRAHPDERSTSYEGRLISLATSEIEELLFPSPIEEATVEAFHQSIKPYIAIKNSNLSFRDQEIQIFLGCRRALLKSDESHLFYQMWRTQYPDWFEINTDVAGHRARLEEVAEEFLRVSALIDEQVENPLHPRIAARLKNDSIYFSILMELLRRNSETPRVVFTDPSILMREARSIIDEIYSQEGARISKSAIRAIIYILITKIVLAFVLELPIEALIDKSVNYMALGINVIFHPLLLLVMTRSIKAPADDNTERIISGIHSSVFGEGHDVITIRASRSKNVLFYIGLIVYMALFILSFGFIIWTLNQLHFSLIAQVLFIMFLTLVSYFGLRIRFTAKRWLVETRDKGFMAFLWDLVTLPIVTIGRWLTTKFQTINIFVFLLDFILETPFKMILRFLDSFSSFVKEKKEEIY